MTGASILKKIRSRAKQLKKKKPGAEYQTLLKQAGSEYKKGKLKKRRKKPAKMGAARPKKRRAAPKRRKARKAKVITRTRVRTVIKTKYRTRKPAKRKAKKKSGRVSGKKSMMPLILLGGAALLAWMVLNPRAAAPPLIITGNASRDSQAQNIIAYAAAAGATATAIANLIKQINASNASQVSTLQQAIQAAPNLSDDSKVQQILSSSYGNVAGMRVLR